ncbi:isocitrate lyase/PEP mutase family protein, partial [Paracoccus sp. PXZ]
MANHSLRSIFDRDTTTITPGAGSPLDVLLIEKLGFELAYLSGYCVAAQRYGVPDIGLIAFREMRETVEAVCDVTSIPLIVDCDTGYGDVLNVRAAVRAMEQAGAAALQFEDQTWPKRCGHMQAKTVEPVEVLVRKVRAAVEARRSDNLVIIARTDAQEILGFDEALRRCKAYKEAGADAVMMHGAHSREHRERLAAEVPGIHFASIGEGEQDLSFDELKALGYPIVVLPSSPLRHSLHAVENYLTHVRDHHEVGP